MYNFETMRRPLGKASPTLKPGEPAAPRAAAVADAAAALLGSLADTIEHALVVTDVELTVLHWNAAMERLTGVSRADACGRPIGRLVPLLDAIALPQHLRRALDGEVTFAAEMSTGAWVEARCAPLLGPDGRVAGTVGSLTDVSEHKRRGLFVRALEAIGRSLTSSLDLNEVLDTIVGKAREVMEADSALVVSWDGGATEFHVMRAAGRLTGQYTVTGAIPVGGGPISRAVLDSRPFTTSNVLTDTRVQLSEARRSEIEREGFKAVAAAPLASKGRVHGALVVHYWAERTFSEEETMALNLLAEQAAMAIDNARLYADATRRAERLRELAEVEHIVAGSLDLDDVLARIAEATARLTGAPVVHLWTVEPGALSLRLRAHSVRPEVPNIPMPATLAFGEGISGTAAEQRTAVFVPDARRDPRVRTQGWAQDAGLGTILAVPILVGDTLLGVLTVRAQPGTLSVDDDQPLVTSLAAQAGTAIQNAGLYRQAQRRREVAEMLARVGREISGTLDVERIADFVAEGVVTLLGGRGSAVFRYDPDDGTLRTVAAIGALTDPMRGMVLEAGEGMAGRAVIQRRLVSTGDVLNEPGVKLSATLRERVATHDCRAIVSAPLVAGDRVLGALSLLAESGRRFSADDFEVLQAFADQAALALEKARLYASAQETLARLRETQAQLIQAGKMSALGQLVSGVAHELNNPLSVIIGYGQLLLNRGVGESQRRPVELMVQQGDRMAKIVRNLLYFARQRPPERTAVDLHQVIEQTLALRLNQLALSGITVEKDFAPALPRVSADAPQLQQVFLNLILNAEQAITGAGRGGSIMFRTRVARAGRLVLADVIDDGPGISPEHQAHVFEPFFTTKQVGSGTGLGLSVSYGIAEEHGGRLTVESHAGRTVFTLELPAGAPTAPAEAPPTANSFPAAGRLALVVEDEPGVVDLITTLLRETGWRVDVAPGGRRGLECVRATRYDLVVSDIRMPDGNGEEFYRRAVAEHPALRGRFLFITGDTANVHAWPFLKEANLPVLEKPFRPDAFLDLVRRIATSLTASGSRA